MINAPQIKIEPIAYLLLIIGVLSDWASTNIGLSTGLTEGNKYAASLISSGLWMQTDFFALTLCILVPFILNRVVDSRVAKYFIGFPLVAGVVKLCASLWNLNLILS